MSRIDGWKNVVGSAQSKEQMGARKSTEGRRDLALLECAEVTRATENLDRWLASKESTFIKGYLKDTTSAFDSESRVRRYPNTPAESMLMFGGLGIGNALAFSSEGVVLFKTGWFSGYKKCKSAAVVEFLRGCNYMVRVPNGYQLWHEEYFAMPYEEWIELGKDAYRTHYNVSEMIMSRFDEALAERKLYEKL